MKPLLLAGLLVSAAAAQPLSYSLLPTGDIAPSPRVDGTIAYDPKGRQIFLFGGRDSAVRNDLWAYSLVRRAWSEVKPADPKPAPRLGQTLIYDPVRHRLILFGGQASGFFSDVWAFDIERGSWALLSPDDRGPNRRYGHSGVYDAARDRMVISHGFTDSGRFDDTWAFELATNTWRNLSPSNRPLRRCLHHAVSDPSGQMLLYGGCSSPSGPCPQGDLWSFDLRSGRWTERTPSSSPPGREHYGMSFDEGRNRLLLFLGQGSIGLLGDTWEFDPVSGVWRAAAVEGPSPSARSRVQAIYASDSGTTYFFGGFTAAGLTNELWSLRTQAVAPVVAGAGNTVDGRAGRVAPGEILSLYGSGLGPAAGMAFAFDEISGELPTSGSGVAVTFNNVAAPLYFVSQGQINVQVPYEVAGAAEVRVVVTVNGQSSAPVVIPVVAANPSLFPRAWNQDGSVNSAANPAARGGVVVLYATGQGVTNPPSRTGGHPLGSYPVPAAPVSLTVGGIEAELLFQGQAPFTAGVMQINARIPANLPAGTSPVVLRVGGAASQTVGLVIQ